MRHKNLIKGFFLILFIFPYLSISAEGDTPEEPIQESPPSDTAAQESSVPKKVALPRSFTPSQNTRITALTEQISQTSPNEVERLFYEKNGFLTLYREAQTNDPQGCIILMHGNNEHPDWPNVIHPVRMKMVQYSWCTLSIEIPDYKEKESLSLIPSDKKETAKLDVKLPNEDIVFGRLNAAIGFANQQGISNISLLGYGSGATYALKYSVEKQLNTGALILVSVSLPEPASPFNLAKLLASGQQPTLDYYIRPNQYNQQYAKARRIAMQQRKDPSPTYTQVKVTSNSQFAIDENQLIQRIRGFLKQNTQQRKQLKQLPKTQKALFYQSP